MDIVVTDRAASERLRRTIASSVRGVVRLYRKSIRRISSLRHPILTRSLRTTLARLGAPPSIILVHSSLSACGYVPGGAAAVISALRAWCVRSTIVMPTHSYCYPDNNGDVPIFDPKMTPSVVGIITNSFVRQPSVFRSLHPTHSLAAQGQLARAIVDGHENCDTPCGAGTPYERLVRWDAGILMFGVTLNSYTLFHTAEDAANVPYLYEAKPCFLKIIDRTGTVRNISAKRQNMQIPRRFAGMADWFEDRGLLQRKPLGRGELLWIPNAGTAHAALLAQLRANPLFLVSEGAREACRSEVRH